MLKGVPRTPQNRHPGAATALTAACAQVAPHSTRAAAAGSRVTRRSVDAATHPMFLRQRCSSCAADGQADAIVPGSRVHVARFPLVPRAGARVRRAGALAGVLAAGYARARGPRHRGACASASQAASQPARKARVALCWPCRARLARFARLRTRHVSYGGPRPPSHPPARSRPKMHRLRREHCVQQRWRAARHQALSVRPQQACRRGG